MTKSDVMKEFLKKTVIPVVVALFLFSISRFQKGLFLLCLLGGFFWDGKFPFFDWFCFSGKWLFFPSFLVLYSVFFSWLLVSPCFFPPYKLFFF